MASETRLDFLLDNYAQSISNKVPSSPATPRRKADLAPPNGNWIIRTSALKKYRLPAPSDLDSIIPISETRNPRGGSSLVRRYNECDVRALAERLEKQSSPTPSPSRAKAARESSSQLTSSPESARTSSGNASAQSSNGTAVPSHLAKKNGPKILRSKAMKEYGLKSVQMDRIKPIFIEPNPHRSGSSMRYYNLCDVEGLVSSITSAAAKPKQALSYECDEYDHDYDYNVFDGLSREDAAELRKLVSQLQRYKSFILSF